MVCSSIGFDRSWSTLYRGVVSNRSRAKRTIVDVCTDIDFSGCRLSMDSHSIYLIHIEYIEVISVVLSLPLISAEYTLIQQNELRSIQWLSFVHG